MAPQKVEYDYLQKIIKFNSDKDIIALREKYKEPTFFEIISKQRSETTYSSFLKWMFQSSNTDLSTVSPILLLLDVLVSRDRKGIIDKTFKTHITTRSFKVDSIEIETEKSVSSLIGELGLNANNSRCQLTDEEIYKIQAKCQDRIDIFINCQIELEKEKKRLQIIIENKIDSTEGGGKSKKTTNTRYDDASQTWRYYMASALNKREDLIQLYVYLAPTDAAECECDKYVQINYQDIIDGIVSPMLASTALSSRERFFLEELKTELTFPSLESNNVRNSIANSDEYAVKFSNLWKEYKKLIIDAAITTSESAIWQIEDNYYNYQPKEELIRICLQKEDTKNKIIKEEWINKTQNDKLKSKIDIKTIDGGIDTYYYNSSRKYQSIAAISGCLTRDTSKNKIENPNDDSAENIRLLTSFWNNNKRFLLAFMNGLKEEDRNKIKCLTEEVSKRDTTKYKIYFGEECLNDLWLDKKSANNAETAWLIIKAWAEKVKGGKVRLEDLQEKFFTPQNCNPYYQSGKWFKYLFYEFKGKDGEYKYDGTEDLETTVTAGGWDFYNPKNDDDKKFCISTEEGENYAIMLKMWRKDGLQKLIDLVTNSKNKYFEEGTLTIQPDK